MGTLEEGVDEDARRVNLVGRELTQFHELLDFCDYVVSGGGHHGVKVTRGLTVDEIAPAIAFPGFDEGEIAAQRTFENVMAAAELAAFFAFGDQGAVAGGREEGRNAGAAG